jgi:hypothetical protein
MQQYSTAQNSTAAIQHCSNTVLLQDKIAARQYYCKIAKIALQQDSTAARQHCSNTALLAGSTPRTVANSI